MNPRGNRLKVPLVLSSLALFVAACTTSTTSFANARSGTSNITLPDAAGKTDDNVGFYYGPLRTTTFVNQVRIYTRKGWKFTTNHAYGWAATSKGAVYVVVPKAERVIDLYVYYGTTATPTAETVPWNAAKPIPLTMRSKAANGHVYTIKLSAVTGDMYNSALPKVPSNEA
jgi:hypothetical protein